MVAPDLPGHGARRSERFSLDSALTTIDDAVASLPGEPPLVVGFSLGGYLALHWAGLERRPIAGIVAASCGTAPNRVVLDGWRVLAAGIHELPDRGLLLNNSLLRLAVREPTFVSDVIAGGVALEVMQDTLRELRRVHTIDSVRAIHEPITFINGALDHFRLQERRFVRAARHGELVHIRGATHLVPLVRPEQFDGAIATALAQLP